MSHMSGKAEAKLSGKNPMGKYGPWCGERFGFNSVILWADGSVWESQEPTCPKCSERYKHLLFVAQAVGGQ